ncbi:MAG: phasin family protein [Paraglaciecola sp.]|jgi:phasin family protein
MFSQFSEQMKNSSLPASELLAANVKAMEAVTKQQTQFFSGLVEDSLKLMQTIAQQTEIKDVLAAQAVYAESLMERFTSTSTVAYNTINSVSQQYTDSLTSGLTTAPTKKASLKTLSVSTETAVVKKPVTVTAKAATKTKSTPKVTAKKPETKMAIPEHLAPKSVAKPAAMPSADEIKVPEKTKKIDATPAPDNK